jgi:hypothetical protein
MGWGYSWLQHQLVFALWRHAHGNVNSAVQRVLIPGLALRFLSVAVTFLLWAAGFAAISQMVISFRHGEGISPSRAYGRLVSQPGWGSLLWGLCWRLVIPGFLLMTLVAGPVGYWILTWMHIAAGTPTRRFESEILSLLLFGTPYLLYVRRFTLAVPLPIVAGDAPIDPLRASAQTSRRWRAVIIGACLVVLGLSNLGDAHLSAMLMAPGFIRPTVIASYAVWIFVSLATSLLWAWLFVFLTEIAIAEGGGEEVEPPASPSPALALNS